MSLENMLCVCVYVCEVESALFFEYLSILYILV